jgi:glyoxylase-like metal-dependent hydrolase (beta-lactamase superfamily II)
LLLLFDKDHLLICRQWGAPLNDIFARVNYSPEHELEAAIAATGNSIKDIKAVIMGHLHLDHAGGLEHFRNTGIPVYSHEIELKHAFYSVATKSDLGVYLGHYLQFDINWQTWSGPVFEIAQGITLRHAPGHTPGLSIMQVNMLESGTWIFTTDMYHVRENYEDNQPQGWLARDHDEWVRSHQMIKTLARRTSAKVVLGHDKEVSFPNLARERKKSCSVNVATTDFLELPATRRKFPQLEL